MRTRYFSLLTFVTLLLATSCMPDSFTKFKEEPPSKRSASGGNAGDVVAPTPIVNSDLLFEIEEVFLLQSAGDTYFFTVLDGTGYTVGDKLWISEEIDNGVATGTRIGVITDIRTDPKGQSDESRTLVVQIGEQIADLDAAANTTYDSDTLSSSVVNLIQQNYYIDNCTSGYANCSAGTSQVTQISSPIVLYVPSSVPGVSGYNIRKRIYIKRNGDYLEANNFQFDYTLTADPLGIGFELGTGDPYDVRLVSPEGPFLTSSSFDATAEPMTLTVSLKVGSGGNLAVDTGESATYNFFASSALPSALDDTDTDADFELTYYLENGHRFAINVGSTSGFSVGEVVRACRFITYSACDTDTEDPVIQGKATISYIDSNTNTIYLTATTFNPGSGVVKSIFKSGLFIHNAGGTAVTTQTSIPYRYFFDTDTGITPLVADFNNQNDATDDPSNVVYEATGLPTGATIAPSTGQITISNNPILAINRTVTVTARNSLSGAVLDTFVLNLNFFGQPLGLIYDGTSATDTTMTGNINLSTTSRKLNAVTDSNSDELFDGDVNFGIFRYELRDPGGSVITTPPAGVSFSDETGELTFSPISYLDTGKYEIRAYMPVFNNSTHFGSVTVDFESATILDKMFVSQRAGDRLLIEVDSVAGFTASTSTINISNESGGQGIVTFIDSDNRILYVEIPSGVTLSGPQVFKAEDIIDATASFVTGRTEVRSVTHVFDTSDANNRFDNGASQVIPTLYTGSSTTVLDTGNSEAIIWKISPNLPSDLRFNLAAGSGAAGNGEIDTSSALNDNNLSPMPATTYTIVAENALGQTVALDYTFMIDSAPSDVSVARYQFVRLSGNGSKFYRGTTISLFDQAGHTGRVLMPVDINDDQINDGILVEYNGDITNNVGIDNVGVFVAPEATAVPYVFVDIKAGTSMTPITTAIASGSTTDEVMVTQAGDEIVPISVSGTRIYARLKVGTVSTGETLTLNADSSTYTIVSVEDRHYVNGILEVSAASVLSNLEVGGYISSDGTGGGTTNGKGIVIQKVYLDTDNNGSSDKWYVMIQHLSGEFDEADQVSAGDTFGTALGTIRSIVGPNINISIAGGAATTNISSSTRGSGTSGNKPFWEGSLIAGWLTGGTHTSTGFSVAGTDYDNQKVVVNVEDYSSHFRMNGTANAYIDDFSEYLTTIDTGESHNHITNIGLSNLIIGYVRERLHIEPTVKGEFTAAILSPSSLPAGLSFDSATGRITGTPTQAANLENYTITFTSSDGTSGASYTFPLVIYNHFTITADTANASSYTLHREGQGLGTSRCRVFGPQINDDVSDTALYNQAIYGTNDLICFLEGAENDLEVQGVDWNINSGEGMCEYVRYRPYSYASHAVGSTNALFVDYNVFDGSQCQGIGVGNITVDSLAAAYVTAATLEASGIPRTSRTFGETFCHSGSTCVADTVSSPSCLYDYGDLNNGPNLDEGSYERVTINCTFTDGVDANADGDFLDAGDEPPTCDCTGTVAQETQCGGDWDDAIIGPIQDKTPALGGSTIYSSFAGMSEVQAVRGGNELAPNFWPNTYLSNYVDFNEYNGGDSCFKGTYNFERYTAPGTLTDGRASWEAYGENGSRFNGNSMFYGFECLDASNARKARIRVLVRDWDREFTPDNADLEEVSATTHTSYPNGVMDSGNLTCFGESCNDSRDLDDIIDSITAAQRFSISSCSGGSVGTAAAITTTRATLTAGSNSLTVTAGASPGTGTVVLIGPGTLNIRARVLSGGATFTVDKNMPSSTTNVQVNIVRTVPGISESD